MGNNKDRTILHCDMNSFFASVELLERPELADVPMAVSGDPEHRHGIILAKNDIAKSYGIVTAETIWQARSKCPDLHLVRPHHKKYAAFSEKINRIYYRYTDMVEPFSIDESWLDVTASRRLFGTGKEIADSIRRTVKEELGLTLSAGVSFNKIFAKMGSEYKKPDATTVISRDNFRDILWPLPAGDFFTVGRRTAEKLTRYGIRTVGDIACSDRDFLISVLGKHGAQIHDYTNGLDDSPVTKSAERSKIKSVGHGITFRRDLTGEEDIRTAVTALSDRVCSRLRRYGLRCRAVKAEIKDPGLRTISRQEGLSRPTDDTRTMASAVMDLISKSWVTDDPIRLLTVTAIDLCDKDQTEQLSIFDADPGDEQKKEIGKTLDEIRKKYGKNAIVFGSVIDNDLGIDIETHSEE